MTRLPNQESDTIEFKESWTDKALKDLAAFANTRGGVLYLGIGHDGTVVGTTADDRQQLLVANQIDTKLRIAAEITSVVRRGVRVLVVSAPRAQRLVRLDGRYYRRVGTASLEMSEDEVAVRLRAQAGQTWDQAAADTTIAVGIAEEKVRAFLRSARNRSPSRLPDQISEEHPLPLILQNLDLLVDGRPTNAAVLLFGKHPERIFRSARIRAGFFRDVNDFDQFPDCVGTIFEQIQTVVRQIGTVYPARMTFPSTIGDGLGERRQETPAYPEVALLEAVVNAVVHRDYTHTGAEIEVKMYPDFLSVWNPGGLMPGVTLADLQVAPHPSARRNPLVAQICFMDHLVERYGTGTTRMITACRGAGLPPPEFAENAGGFQVMLRRHGGGGVRRSEAQELASRQRIALEHVAAQGSMTSADYQRLTGVSGRTARRDLKELVNAGLLRREGTREGLRYLPGPKA